MSPPVLSAVALMLTLALLFLLAGCGGPDHVDDPPAIGTAHIEAPLIPVREVAASPTLAPAGDDSEAPGGPDPERRLEDPWPALVSGIDFSADEHRARQRAAQDDAFADTLADGIDATAFLDAVLARNPMIASKRAAVEAVMAEHSQIEAVKRVLSMYAAFTRALRPMVGPMLPRSAGADAFPLPGPDGIRSRIVAEAVGIARADFHATLRTLVADARAAYAAGVFLQHRIAIVDQHLQLVRIIREVDIARLTVDGARALASLELTAAVRELENVAADSRRMLGENHAMLRRLLAVDARTPIGALAAVADTTPLESDAFALWRASVTEHPRLHLVRHKQARVALMGELVEVLARPGMDLGLSDLPDPLADDPRFRDRPPSAPPGPWFGMMESYRAELLHRQRALRAAESATRDRLAASAARLWESYRTAVDEHRLQRDVLVSLAEQALTIVRAKFATYAVDIDRLLAALRAKLNTGLAVAAARRDVETRLARLDALLGPRE